MSTLISKPPLNFHEEVIKIMYYDGFHKTEQHGLWKLKKQLTSVEWNHIKDYFQYFHKGDKEVSNMKYFGWATTNPVKVMLLLRELNQ